MFEYVSPQAKRERDMYVNLFCDLAKSNFKDVNGKREVSAPEHVILAYIEKLKEEPIYRLVLHDDGTVETTCYEMLDAFDPQLKKWYESIDELPKWVQDKIAVLMLLDHTKTNEEIENVGRRISKDVFWVFTGETNGDNPRG
jgi:hypothetical protein